MKEKSTILIVDDSELNRMILADILGDEYNFIEAENGARAIELLQTHTDIDLILLDMVMPEMNGFDVLTAMNNNRQIEDIPVVMISAENGIEHIEDSTNFSDDYSRNLIRHKVMPVLRQINPALSDTAGRTAELLGRDEDCLSSLASDFVEKNLRGGSLPAKELGELHPAIASRVLRQLLGTGLTMEQTDAALRICRSTGVRSLDIIGRRLVCDQGRLYLAAQESVMLPERAVIPGTVTEMPEAGLRMSVEFTEYREEINGLFKTYYIKYENINSAVICTGRRPGDRMRPLGRGCTKSLKSLFMEAGFSQHQRDTAPVIRDDKGILAVCGIAVDERAAPKAGDRVLKISFSEI